MSNMTSSRRGGNGQNGPSSVSQGVGKSSSSMGKQGNSKLYQKYRKLYEHEKKEKDRIFRQLKDDQSELAKLRNSNSTLNDQVKRMRHYHVSDKEMQDKISKMQS